MKPASPIKWFRSLVAPRNASPAPAPNLVAEAFDFDDPRIPDTSKDRVAAIRDLIIELGRSHGAAHVPAMAEAQRIHDVYLPQLMNSYFAIPADYRAVIFRETGRSASFLLNERLDTLLVRLRHLTREIAQQPIDSFTNNLHFLDSRFGLPDLPFPWERD